MVEKSGRTTMQNIGIAIYSGVDFKKQAEYFKKLGVTSTFIGSETADFDGVVTTFADNGIVCESLHAPYKNINDMWSSDETVAQTMLGRLKDSVDKCAKYSIPVSVVHLSSGVPMPEINELGIARFEELFSYAEEKGVKIALENQRFLENLSFFLDRYPNVGFCWDAGHEYGFTHGINFMDMYGNRAIALHIHDNRAGINTDDHLLPFDGKIDFNEVAGKLVRNGYTGTIMLEISKEVAIDGKKVYADLTEEEYMDRAYSAVKKLAVMVEELKK